MGNEFYQSFRLEIDKYLNFFISFIRTVFISFESGFFEPLRLLQAGEFQNSIVSKTFGITVLQFVTSFSNSFGF